MNVPRNLKLVDLEANGENDLLYLSEKQRLEVMQGLMMRPGEDFLEWFSLYLQRTVAVDFAFVGEVSGEDWDQIQTLKVAQKGEKTENFAYDLKGTPCVDVLGRDVCFCPKDVAQKYPEDALLVDMGLEAYVGISLLSESETPLGIAVLLHTKEVSDASAVLAARFLRIFRPRLESELVYRNALRVMDFAVSDAVTSQASIKSLLEVLCKETRMNSAWVSELIIDKDHAFSETLVFIKDGGLQDNFKYDVENTPCVDAAGGKTVAIPCGVQALYPDIKRLKDLQAETLFSVPLKNNEGMSIGLLVVTHDRPVHEGVLKKPLFQMLLSRIEAEFRRLQAEEKRAELERCLMEGERRESIGALAGGIAHDFNNLLFVMSGQALVLQLETQEGEEEHEQLQAILDAAEQGADLCQQLLTYAGKKRSVVEELDLNVVLKRSKRIVKMLASDKVELNYKLCEQEMPIVASQTQLQQIVMNLVKNAGDAIQKQGVVRLETEVQKRKKADFKNAIVCAENLKDGEYAVLRICDTGAGLSEKEMRRVFDPFFTTKNNGHGLGLSVVLGAIKAHHGAIEIASVVGQGTTFTVSLPLVVNEAVKDVSENTAQEEEKKEGSMILIIDDDRLVRKTLSSMLKSVKKSTLLAQNGAEGIALFRQNHAQISAIILDYSMPGMCGDEVLVALREISRSVPVLLASGNVDLESVNRFPEKPDAYMGKPFSLRALIETLQGMVTSPLASTLT